MARPKQFDCGEALGKAMDVFWTQGYEATSVQDLLDAMEINRASMYDTFGDKRSLFLEAMRCYLSQVQEKQRELLTGASTPLAGVEELFAFAVGCAAEEGSRGCLFTNAIVELGPHDAEVSALVRETIAALEGAMVDALEAAKRQGEIEPSVNSLGAARHLFASIQGLMVLGKADVGSETLEDVARQALSTLHCKG